MALTRLSAPAVIGVTLLMLTACSTSTDDPTPSPTESATQGEETAVVTLYSGRDEELVAPLLEQFTAATGIEVEARYAGSTELAAQILEEGEATPAQVFFSQDQGALGVLAHEGLLTTLPASVSADIDPQYTSSDNSWVGLTGRARVIAYDSEALDQDEVPTDIYDLTDPEWNGRIGFAPTNASFQAHVTAIRIIDGEDAAEEWLNGLIANDAQVFERNGAILEAVNTGVVDLGLINQYYWYRLAETEGADTLRAQIQYGEAGTSSALVNVTGAGILAGNEDSAEALALVEYLASAEAAEYFVTQTKEHSVRIGGATPEGAPSLSDLSGPDVDYDDFADLEGTVALLEKVGLI